MLEIDIDGIGMRISRLRKAKRLTLKEMAEYTGLSVGFLSNLETGKTSPTIDNLRMVASALQMDILDLICYEKQIKKIVREDERRVNQYPAYNMTVEVINFGVNNQIYEMITIEPGKIKLGPMSRHLYPETCTVLEGELTVELDEEVYKLHKNDSIYIPENVSHRIYNDGGDRSLSYWTYLKL